MELQLAPLGRRGLAALAPHPGERVLDIGCGGGETALDLARAVAPDGTVVGIDLSAAVLAVVRCPAKGCERVRFVQADAQVFPFEPVTVCGPDEPTASFVIGTFVPAKRPSASLSQFPLWKTSNVCAFPAPVPVNVTLAEHVVDPRAPGA